jgi:7-carboxy-7-deazaguanine synthase
MQPNSADRKGALLRISEIYESIQGEGLLTGTPSVFLRTSGCNLRCWFCDTPFASWKPEGNYQTIAQILEQVAVFRVDHIVLTGGEPLIFNSVVELCRQLKDVGYHITIETAATIFHELPCDLMSISPKLSGSAPAAANGTWRETHHRRREQLAVVRQLMQRHSYQLKFVVNDTQDAEEVLDYLARLGEFDGQRVLLMPQGTDVRALDHQAEWLIPWCKEHNVRFCPRSHIHWFGNTRRT